MLCSNSKSFEQSREYRLPSMRRDYTSQRAEQSHNVSGTNTSLGTVLHDGRKNVSQHFLRQGESQRVVRSEVLHRQIREDGKEPV